MDVAVQAGEEGPELIESLKTGLGNRIGSDTSAASAGKPTPEASRFQDEEIIEEAKYHSPAPVFPTDEGELPHSYAQTKLTLMVVNPYLVYAYWVVDVTRLPPKTVGAALRFHDSSEPSPSRFFDVDIDLRTRNWYVHLWSPAKSYYAELGVKTADGGFTSIARSNPLQTPRAWPVATASLPFTEPIPPEAARVETALRPNEIATNTGHEERTVVSPTAVARQPEVHKPADAAAVLQRRLSEIYSLRPLHPRALAATVSAEPVSVQYDAPSPGRALETFLSGVLELPSPQDSVTRPSQPTNPVDLTTLAEHKFHPGFSSSLLSPTPERSPG